GAFQVTMIPAEGSTPGYTSLVGKVYDGPTPSQLVWEVSSTEGGCKLLKPRVPFCSAGCGSAVCVEDDVCQAYPTAQNLGTIKVKGLLNTAGETEFSVDPIAKTYQKTDLQYPAFAEGGDVSITVSDSAFSTGFVLKSRGVSQLTLASGTLSLEKDTALALNWTAPGTADISKIHVKLDISHHGGTKGKIECDVADNGTLVLPAGMITELLGLGYAGFPSIVVTRSAAGSAVISAGKVEIVVSSGVESQVKIQGLISCNDDEDCPEGETCQDDLTCK
ncbi:MAG: hypothetical protein WC889_11555, partial [Myxococcota bacterium]